MTPREIAHKFARKAMVCEFNKHADKSPEHSKFCDALEADITHAVMQSAANAAVAILRNGERP